MTNKKNKVVLAGVIALSIISGSMFLYQNIYMPKQQKSNLETVYLANKDIQAYSTIDESMFDTVSIPKTANMDIYVNDISKIQGQKIKGGILKGEPLDKIRLTKDDSDKNKIQTPIQANYMSELEDGDFVNVYVLLENKNDESNSSVQKVLSEKKISIKKSQDGIVINSLLSEEELKNYFIAQSKGNIIVSKINNLDISNLSSEDTEKLSNAKQFDKNSKEVKNAIKKTEDGKEMAISYYTVKNGDTLDSLSIKFKTKKDIISQLNNGKTDFDINEQIAVPAI